MKKPCCVLSVALYVTALATSPAWAAETVKIGVIYPLTGNAASAGQSAKDAINLGVEIVNTAHPDLKALPLGATAGSPISGAPRSSSTRRIIKAIRRWASSKPCA